MIMINSSNILIPTNTDTNELATIHLLINILILLEYRCCNKIHFHFLSFYRIYEDEAISTLIANSAAKGQTFIALVGNGRTKFGYGIQERISRILKSKFDDGTTSSTQDVDVVSMLLNPSANDSESPTAQLLLTLGYGPILKEQRPLANYLWFSTSPPTKILTRPKNPISAEDEKPAGESSIIGAFGNRKSSDKAIGGATAGDK